MCDRTDIFLQQFPCFNAVEYLEQKNAKDYLRRINRQVVTIDHPADKVLTDPIRSPISVGEFVGKQYRVFGPRRREPLKSTKEDPLPLHRKTPIGIIRSGRLER